MEPGVTITLRIRMFVDKWESARSIAGYIHSLCNTSPSLTNEQHHSLSYTAYVTSSVTLSFHYFFSLPRFPPRSCSPAGGDVDQLVSSDPARQRRRPPGLLSSDLKELLPFADAPNFCSHLQFALACVGDGMIEENTYTTGIYIWNGWCRKNSSCFAQQPIREKIQKGANLYQTLLNNWKKNKVELVESMVQALEAAQTCAST
ncbi:uncharacterized protein LOC115999313 [Ipomoea triloba]|uniref:uncharacterized protein LOC115999313 n=1 Tax=Ipomoea triloba TaxID=35885 RepID=UPI00125D666D|nr:uncharacterized protein LOC115999313 [Ipomoea triloba]